MRRVCIVAILAVFFVGFAVSASRMETLRAEGVDALLPLAPVDPRALLLGDYMTLAYTVNDAIMDALRQQYGISGRSRADLSAMPGEGVAVLRLEPGPAGTAGYPVARFARLEDGTPPGPGEARIGFKVRRNGVITASPSFYFSEGDAAVYLGARYGRVKLGREGKTLLVGLCDEDGNDLAARAEEEGKRQ